jgi:hypothetical protein
MRRYAFIPFALSTVALFIGCSSDDSPDSAPTPGEGGDASTGGSPDSVPAEGGGGGASASDGGVQGEGGGAGAGGNDAGEVVSEITSSLGSTGDIHIFNDAVMAAFHEDDTILRSDAAPDCVVHVRSETKPFSPAGTLTIGGPVVGSEGGPASLIEVTPDATGYYDFAGAVFPATDELLLQIEASSTATFPSMNVQSLPLPPVDPVVVTKPALPESGALALPSTQPLEIAWTVPSEANADLRVGVRLNEMNGEGSKHATLYCSFPLSAGAGQVPAELLSEIENQVGANGRGLLEVHAGSQREFTSKGASYIIAVLRPETIGLQVEGELQ